MLAACVMLFQIYLSLVAVNYATSAEQNDASESSERTCFRWGNNSWDKTGRLALDWKTDGFVDIEFAGKSLDKEFNKELDEYRKFHPGINIRRPLPLTSKAVTQFYGGLDQHTLMDRHYGTGGIIGSSMAVSAAHRYCKDRPQTIRVLVCQIVKAR